MDSLGLSDLVGKLMPLQSSLLPRLKSNVPPIVLETRNLVKPGSQIYERRWGLVQSSLYVLHNLARAAPNRHFFNNTEAKRVLHIYAGSDAIGRYLPAMLALSYVVETENEFDLIKDERELITTITNELKKIVSGSESGFSLDELLEGFENLSMNQENKKKIVAMAVPVLVQSKEKCDKHEKADISRILVKLGSVEKDDVQSDKSTDDKSESVAVKDAALSGTLASLKSAVDYLKETSKDSFSEVKEKLDSMNEAATKFQRKERRVIVSGFVDINGSVDTLMELARYYYGNGGDALYRDGNRWEALNSLVNVFWNYTDASKSFAAAAGEAGLVKFLLDVCDNHYQLLKTKILALSDLIGKYHGDEPQHSQAKVHKSKQPVPEPKTAAKPTETKSEKENQDVSGIGSKSLLFKGLGVRAGIKDGGRVAYRIDAEHAANDKAVFVTNKPLPTGTLFEIQIDRMDQNKPETLEFGVTMYQEFPDDVFYHGDGYGQGQGFWFLRGTDFYKDFERIGGGYKWNLNKLSEGDRVGIARHPNSALHYYYNGEDMGMAFRNIPQDVYPLTAVTGKCLQVSIADPPSDFAIPKDSASEAEFVEPFERFRFTTGTRHTEEFSRMRTPFGQDFIDKARYPRQAEIYAKPVAADSPEMGLIEQALPTMLSGAAKERDKLTDISKKSKRLGYQQEADSLYVIDHLLSHATTMSQPFMRIDPVSKSLISLIASNVSFFGGYLQVTDSNRIDSKEPNKLYGRLADIFKYVLKPCFNNVKNLDGYVWTGSTSEGFAITDHSKQGVRYLNDEMDLMIPVAMVAESTKTDNSSACGDSTAVSERGRLEESSTAEIPVEDIGRIVSQLEEVGMAPPSDDPPLEWVPTSPPGYVRVRIRGDRKHNFSEEFINEACCIIPFGGLGEIYLSRLKLLKIQEAHVLSRIPAVQSDIDKNFKTFGGFHGCVELVQQGPVQTLSVHYNARSLEGSSATTAEFEQTADGALALTCTQWPSMAKDWATRDRKWPTSDVVRAVVEAGCHVVPKSYPGEGGDEYLQWRLSFSLAERTLAHCFSENQRKFYLVIKKIWRMHLKEPSVLSSYHMKTTMFWTSEKIAPHQWRKDMLGDHFISYIDTLIGFLEQGDIPNFFIPENNMVSHLPPNDIDVILGKVRHIRKNPLEYTKDVSTPSSTFQMIH